MTTYEGEDNQDNVNVIDDLKEEKSASSAKSRSSVELLDEPMSLEPVILSRETVLLLSEEDKPRE